MVEAPAHARAGQPLRETRQDLGMLRQRGQGLQSLHGDVGGSEEDDSAGKPALWGGAGFEGGQEAAVQLRPGGVADGFTISGSLGSDAKRYQIRAVESAIEESKK